MTRLILIKVLCFSYTITLAEDKNIFRADWDFIFNPENFNTDFSNYDQQSAEICCKLSYLAYYRKEDIKEVEDRFNEIFPKLQIKIDFYEIKETGTQLIFFGCNSYIIVAFRGTEFSKFKDVKTDAKYFSYRTKKVYKDDWMNMPPGHGGFRSAVKSIINAKIIDELSNFEASYSSEKKLPIYTTGHSLGAGLSIFAIEPIKYHNDSLNYKGTYAFATPLTLSKLPSDSVEVSHFTRSNGHLIHNVIHYRDYVSRAGLNNKSVLKHVGNYYRICLNHEIVKNEPVAIRSYKLRRFGLLKYHTIVNILKYIQYEINSSELVHSRTIKKCLCEEDQYKSYSDKLIKN